MEAEEWYELRNDRTNRIDQVLLDSSSKRIGIIIQDPGNYQNQLSALFVLNIMARWCRKLIIEMQNDVQCFLYNRTEFTLKELLQQTVQQADPYGDFKFETIVPSECEMILKIGGNEASINSYWIASSGWIGGYGYGMRKHSINQRSDLNPVGAAFAASCINAEMFSNYVGLSEAEGAENWCSLFDNENALEPLSLNNPELNTPVDIGRVWQIGAGAVGSSFDYIISFLPMMGSLDIIDFDRIKVPNTSSSLIFSGVEAFQEIKKVEACKRVLSETNSFQVNSHDSDYSGFVEGGHVDNRYPDCILCFANEKSVWSTIQYNDPPMVFHATTSRNWGVNFGRHIPLEEWCIVCRFGITDHVHTPTCSEGSTKTKNGKQEKLGVLPFLAPAAGSIILSELIAASQFRRKVENFVQLSLRNSKKLKFLKTHLGKKTDCPICSGQSTAHYHRDFNNSKYCGL